MSRFRLLLVAVCWCIWAVASPIAWTGCTFQVGTIFPSPEIQIHIVIGNGLDESKVIVAYGEISGDEQNQACYPRPSGGWGSVSTYYYYPKGTMEHLVFTVSGYDDTGHLVCVGQGESTNMQDVTVTVQATIPWST